MGESVRSSFQVCPHARSCPMFELFRMQASLRIWQLTYCELDEERHGRCERFRRATVGESVPSHLLPNGQLLQLKRKA